MSDKHDAYPQIHLYPRTLKVARIIQRHSRTPVSLTFLINDAACYQLEKHLPTGTSNTKSKERHQ